MSRTGWSEKQLSEHVFGDVKAANYVNKWLQPGTRMPPFRLDPAKRVADYVRDLQEGADVSAELLRKIGSRTVVENIRSGVPVD
jgi:hypothetical protein